jgi:enamine deaminase RidA (YjgF/YER057c/UK114 family)
MSAEINIYNPEELGPPMGQYTHVTRVRANEFLFVAGMLSGDAAGNVIGEGEFDVQTVQVSRNIEAALKSAGASWANVVQFTTYLVHSQDIPKFMQFRLREFPKMFPDGKYPPNTPFSWSTGWSRKLSWSKCRQSPPFDQGAAGPAPAGHSGQVSPIQPRTPSTAAFASSAVTPSGGSSRTST